MGSTTPSAGVRLGLFAAARAGWALAAPYFRDGRWRAKSLLAGVVAADLVVVLVNIIYSYWNAAFFNALADRNWRSFVILSVVYNGYMALWVAREFITITLRRRLIIRWRQWMTERYLAAWLDDGVHYRLRVSGVAVDNPDQRIAEDVPKFIEDTLDKMLGLLSTLVAFVSFSTILWRLSRAPLSIFGISIPIPGVLLLGAFVYATIGTWVMNRLNRALIPLDFAQQRAEADFRFGLAHVREASEDIALSRGEPAERILSERLFGGVVTNWYALLRKQRLYSTTSAIYSQLPHVFPYILIAPLYFSGSIPLGALTQAASAFNTIRNNLSHFVTTYSGWAYLASVISRLYGFELAVTRAPQADGSHIGVVSHSANTLVVENLVVTTPGGRAIVEVPALTLSPGERIVLRGPSGAGKTSVIRALVGRWPFGQGTIRHPRGGRILALPQRGYLPIGVLRDALAYPEPASAVTDAQLRDALEHVGLGSLAARLDENADWSTILSTGERQRVAIARVLLSQPDTLFLDEATSALELASEIELLGVLRARLPHTSMLWATHRSPHPDTYDRRVDLVREEDTGSWALVEEPAVLVAT